MKKIFTKTKVLTLTVAIVLSATTVSAQKVYDFKKWAVEAGQSAYKDYLSYDKVEGTDLRDTNNELVDLYYINDLSANDVTLELDRHFAVSNDIQTGTFYFSNTSNCGGFYAYGSGVNETYFSIVNLKAGDVVRVVYNGTILKYANTNATYFDAEGEEKTTDPALDWTEIKQTVDGATAITGYAADGSAEYGTPELTVKADGRIDFQLTGGSRYHGILRVYIRTVEDVVYPPTSIKATGAYFGERTITIECPNTSSGDIPAIAYTLNGTDPLAVINGEADGEILEYNETEKPVISETTTIKAIAYNPTTEVFSSVTEATIEAGTTITLEPATWSKGNIATVVVDSATMEKKYFSSIVINDTTQNVIGMPQVYYIIGGDSIKAKWATGNVYSYTYAPQSLDAFQVEIWADGYNSTYLTVDGISEYARQTVVDFTTYEPSAEIWTKSDLTSDDPEVNLSWAEAWALPEGTEYYYPTLGIDEEDGPVTIAEGVTLSKKNFILAKGIGLIPNGSGSVTLDTEDENLSAEFEMYNANSLENISSIWRTFANVPAYTYTWQSSWNMALKALYSYNEVGSSSTGVSELQSAEVIGSGAIYNLNGVRVQKPAKGLYIKDGKKYIVR
ncbi:MAG: chitobiase/beta-hexosaminidase C-terminal domain-containing protein [Prevotella sp.]|nr:chitobiase/beta-hexosaminidase C-terminal domain-containing protein [Prevotella sp.]